MKGLDKEGQGPTSGCCAIEEQEEDNFLLTYSRTKLIDILLRTRLVSLYPLRNLGGFPPASEYRGSVVG
jgi:hypothetical protein